MSKLHEIFLSQNPNFNHSQAIKNLIKAEQLDINAQDEDGNTILHLMAIHIYKNYHNPYLKKDNPNGEFLHHTGYRGHYSLAYNNYQGPDFLEDMEVLLRLGADPKIKNKHGESAIYLFFTKAYDFLETPSTNKYFDLIQKYHPHFLALIDIFKTTDYLTNPKFHDQRYEKGFNKVYYRTWIERELLKVLDERWLTLDGLESLIKWIDLGNLQQLDTQDNTICELRRRLLIQIDYQKKYPGVVDAVKKIAQFYHQHKDIFFRGMLINDPRCPIYQALEQLNDLDREKMLTSELNDSCDKLLQEYNIRKELAEELKAIPLPLDNYELSILKALFADLDHALNGKAHLKAYLTFNQKTDYSAPKNGMSARLSLFQKYCPQFRAVKAELEHHSSGLRHV